MLNQSWILVKILKLGSVKILKFKFIRYADVWLRSWCSVEILKMKWIKICVWACDMTLRGYFGKMNSTLGSVVPLAMFGWELWQLTSKLQTRKLKICWLWIPFTNRWWWSIASSYNRRIYFIESGAKNIDKGTIGQRHCVFNPYWVKLRHETCPKFYTAKILG